jgi:hypothetical protein
MITSLNLLALQEQLHALSRQLLDQPCGVAVELADACHHAANVAGELNRHWQDSIDAVTDDDAQLPLWPAS